MPHDIKNITKYRDSQARTIFDAAQAMVSARDNHDTMNAAVEQVLIEFPEIPPLILDYIWVGVNSKSNSL